MANNFAWVTLQTIPPETCLPCECFKQPRYKILMKLLEHLQQQEILFMHLLSCLCIPIFATGNSKHLSSKVQIKSSQGVLLLLMDMLNTLCCFIYPAQMYLQETALFSSVFSLRLHFQSHTHVLQDCLLHVPWVVPYADKNIKFTSQISLAICPQL